MTQNVEQLVQETKESYYAYIVKVQGGCEAIIASLKAGDNASGLQGIIDLSEGLAWLLDAEQLLSIHSYKIDSPIASVSPLFGKMNDAIEANDFATVIALLEDEVKPLFTNAAEWKFEEITN
ncbi:hypothetical protein MKX47_03265 [Solibacillus sp. FSL R7-0668]|uniref:hypothetical protein n=1 Tax=Solibacillus sp. FSL R7-0668 TaxID=2921688 RepID=UPI0030F8520E